MADASVMVCIVFAAKILIAQQYCCRDAWSKLSRQPVSLAAVHAAGVTASTASMHTVSETAHP